MSGAPGETLAASWAVYGAPLAALAPVPAEAIQVSPLTPGATPMEALGEASLDRVTVQAPAGALERAYVLAQALRVLKPGGVLTALAPKTLGGSRLRGELEALGCPVAETARRHHRICVARAPGAADAIAEAIVAGGPRALSPGGLWTWPGVFSWDRLDPGTALLIEKLPALAGRGADFGCGLGLLARAVLAHEAVTALDLIDLDARAVAMSRRNVADPRARIVQADLRDPDAAPGGLDFVVMNPPFHLAGHEDRGLGEAFIAAAARALRPGGLCLLVANLTLPYERALEPAFRRWRTLARRDGFKVLEAVK